MHKREDTDIIKKLESEKKADRQEAMLSLYQLMYDKVRLYIEKNNGTAEEAKDVFQDSLLALFKHARNKRLGPEVNLKAYFFTICKNHWLKELQKKKRTVQLSPKHEQFSSVDPREAGMMTEEHNQLVDQLISKVGQSCYTILKYYYYERRRMKEIAQLMQLSSEQAAKDKKASCMKKLRALVRTNSYLLKLLK